VPVRFRTLNHRPPHALDSGAVGARWGGTWRKTDFDLYHYSGPETGPNAALGATAFRKGTLPPRIRADAFLRQTHDVIHMTGADAAAAFGGLTVRAEGAWFVDRPYLRPARDLVREIPLDRVVATLLRRRRAAVPLGELFPSIDSFEWGIGADYVTGGWEPVVQLNQVIFLERTPRLLVEDPVETRLSASVKKGALADRLALEVAGGIAIRWPPPCWPPA